MHAEGSLATRYTKRGMDRMGTWQTAAFYLAAILLFLGFVNTGLISATRVLLSVHWALAVLVFTVTTISFAAGLWGEREQLRQISWRMGDKSLRTLFPLVMPLLIPLLAWATVVLFRSGGVSGLVSGAFASLVLLYAVTLVAFRLALRREFSLMLLIGSGIRAVWRNRRLQ